MTEFSTCFFIEQAVEAREGVPGRRPKIDHIIRGEDMKGNIPYAIPTEAKAHATFEDGIQLHVSSYVCKLVSARDLAPNVLVGLLIDQQDVSSAFSTFSLVGLVLPLTIIGPSMKWRMVCHLCGQHAVH